MNYNHFNCHTGLALDSNNFVIPELVGNPLKLNIWKNLAEHWY
jgi:hypothetical protein